MTDIRCSIRHRDGTVSTVDVPLPLEPSEWTAEDARETLWACIRLLDVPVVQRVSLVEADAAVSWRIEVVARTGTLTPPALPLSSMALVWLSEAVFEPPWVSGVH